MKIFFLPLVCMLSTGLFAQSKQDEIAIIPQPVSVIRQTGSFTLPTNIHIHYSTDQQNVVHIADILDAQLKTATGYTISKSKGDASGATISLSLNKQQDKQTGTEGYTLEVTDKHISINANQPAGLFYGVQTLLQLLPPAIESKTVIKNTSWNIPAVKITDYPRFAWRGLMFDVSRHFFTKQEVKKFIDEMAAYKFNLLHMHLTDDQGWRIEIRSAPKLTEVGAWRVDKTGTFGKFSDPEDNEAKTYGGFFTQDDIKELVKYAGDQYVNIMPEIDVPGHSMAAVASYPELSCTPGTYSVNSGEKVMNWFTGGFTAIRDNTLCPANENVYVFLDKMFTEIAQLFPFPYIHMGGDECAKNFWEKSDAIKALMKKEKLKNMEEVQSYFVKRVEKIIESKGKKMIGWDEILEGGLAPNAVVMSWRGMKGGIDAAKMGHQVVMSPTTFAYLDFMQSDAAIEPPVYATLRLKKAYEFEPVPAGIDDKYILGGQGNLWTEQIYNMRHLQYMLWPRAFATAESVWSPANKKDWQNFVPRVEKHFERFNAAERNYSPAMYDPTILSSNDKDGNLLVNFETELNDLQLHYSFDNSFPDQFYPSYKSTGIAVPKDAVLMRVISYRNGKPAGRMISIPVTELKNRVVKKK